MDLQAQWIVGLVDGVGDFSLSINRKGEVQFEFTVIRQERDVQVLYALKAYFGCGVVRKSHGNQMVYRVRRIEHLTEMVIPFFEKHKLKTKKGIAFQKFRQVLLKIKRGDHLTPEGIEEIRNLLGQFDRLENSD